MSMILYQCSASISSSDDTIDLSSMYTSALDLTINQTNTKTRGLNGLTQKGFSYKTGLDTPNTWVVSSRMISNTDMDILQEWYISGQELNISVVYNEGVNAGKKLRLSSWVLSNPPIQASIGADAQDAQLTFTGFLFDYS